MINYSDIIIVGLGASAGGFEALQKFLEKIEEHEKITYVIVQHLDPNQPTMLGNLLSKYTKLGISMIKDNDTPKGNQIYFCPPNNDLTIKNGKFILSEPREKAYPKPSINKFFESLALEKKEKAIGIILSGTGSDGAKGIEEIHHMGGITLAEDEGAKYFSMPKAAIDTGYVDSVLPPELMAEGIPYVINDRNYFTQQYEVKGSVYKIFDLLNKKTNIDFSSYKENTILRRIKKRINENKKTDIDEYIDLLNQNTDELEILKNELLIIVTSFFRGDEAFKELERELENLILEKSDNILRVWIPACATGEEAFTIAIIIKEILRKLNISKKVTIFATDVSDIAIESARNKNYSIEQMFGVKNEYIERYFDEKNTGYRPKKEIRDMIIFSKHDVIKDPPFSNLDLISCRNLLIYFNSNLQKVVMNVFYYALRFNGLLFLGQSETVGNLSTLFTTIHSKNKLYKKTNDLGIISPETINYTKKKASQILNEASGKDNNKALDIDFVINKAISQEYCKNGIVIDSNSMILFYKGDTSDYISQPQGIVTQDLFRLAKDYIKLDLRATINEAKKNNKYAISKKIKIFPFNSVDFYILITVFPLEINKLGNNNFYVAFDKITEKDVVYKKELSETMNQDEISILEEELLSLKERLQITIEELETSNEELQSTNEELQSTNEELQTVNDELSFKNSELEFAQKAFHDVLSAIKADVLIVDKSFNILKYTDGILKFFDIKKTNVVNFSTVLLNATVKLPNLLEDLKTSLLQDKEIGYEVILGTKVFWFRVSKIYMTSKNHNDDVGLVLSFLDRTEIFEKDKILFQQSKMAAMGEMIGNIAHQWRQPLNNLALQIALFVHKLENGTLDASYINSFKIDYDLEIKHMSQTIDDFKDFLTPSKNYDINFVHLAIDRSLKMIEDSLKFNQISINYKSGKQKFYGCINELSQVILNIFNNSKEVFIDRSIKDREINITIGTNGKYSVISIIDNGMGVEEKYFEHISKPYFTTKKDRGGTGIGLYMSKTIVEHMGGKIIFQNTKNGFKVNIYLLKDYVGK
ncbi:chemotaxis protein CheB [Arcobacter sp. FWKO B]|uniref:chemotaxis protein CheB n=1 Tax=Arcobacter sp. FWKO B TaxID=2593672 RepID=UPI0018A5CC39|nr:chemotaxis protein CheB [Arcobacter sp. FWKO B]QOG12831.1 GHKL domain-containing protein [Arcobacter sp. FWKO B]